MKRLYAMAAAVPLLVMVAAAQDVPRRHVEGDPSQDGAKMKAELDAMMTQMKVVGLSGAAMGALVKGAPYSAVEVTESNQVLADGTRIHNENQTTVYRDSEGRVRRETPNQTTILDPVAGVSYFLNPKTQTATKTPLSMPVVYRRTAAPGAEAGAVFGQAGPNTEGNFVFGQSTSEKATFEVKVDKEGGTSVTVNGRTVDPSTVAVDHTFAVSGDTSPDAIRAAREKLLMAQDKLKAEMAVSAGAGGVLRSRITSPGKTDALGTQMIEGVNAEGTRLSTTLDTGAIGNDRPIQMVNERWFSPELKTVVMTKHSDPRTGEEIFRLTNISRAEPGADLFQVPTSYQIVERK